MDGGAGRRDDGARVDALRLIRSRRVGPVTFHRLLADHGSATAALAALPGIAEAAGIERYAPASEAQARGEIAAARALGARMLCTGDDDYPALLAEVPDAPPVLWLRGDAAHLSRPMIAMVGARNASSLGVRMARRLAETLGEAGFTVVSGLARGIDAAAHEAALGTGTVAVVAGGADIAYPPENAGLMARIAEAGCVLSEQPMGTEPQARHFPLRNRIVSGLCRAVIVVEAAARSGSLITARTALDQGREVLAVPGHPFDARAAGCNLLIRDGAVLVRDGSDVIEALSQPARAPSRAGRYDAPTPHRSPRIPPAASRDAPVDPSSLHGRILDRLGPSPVAEDQLIRDLGLSPALVAPELLSLEMEGLILRQAGGLLSRAG